MQILADSDFFGQPSYQGESLKNLGLTWIAGLPISMQSTNPTIIIARLMYVYILYFFMYMICIHIYIDSL